MKSVLSAGVLRAVAVSALFVTTPLAAMAGEAWDDVSSMLFGERLMINAGEELVALNIPYRTTDDRRTEMGATISAPAGRKIRSVYLVIDENPMPVSAVFEMARPVEDFTFSASMRLNGPSGIHIVLETDTGALFVSEGFTKTSGLGACAAPPGTDPQIALKTLGQMDLKVVRNDAPALDNLLTVSDAAPLQTDSTLSATLRFDHPSHSGLQMDQITLLYLPARFIETVGVAVDEKPWFTMTGSISLSENPTLTLELPKDAELMTVRMTDTEGATFLREFILGNS